MSVFNFSGEKNGHDNREMSDGASFLLSELVAGMQEINRYMERMTDEDQQLFGVVQRAYVSNQAQHAVEAPAIEPTPEPPAAPQVTEVAPAAGANFPAQYVDAAERLAPVVPISSAPSFTPQETNIAVNPNTGENMQLQTAPNVDEIRRYIDSISQSADEERPGDLREAA